MANINGKAYGLTLLCPIKNGCSGNRAFSALTRRTLQRLPLNEHSPIAQVPNTYLCRFYILSDVFYEQGPARNGWRATLLSGWRAGVREEHLKSEYLVFESNFHGDLDSYLEAMWHCAEQSVKAIWQHCVGFERVRDAQSFSDYVKRCQIDNQLFFNGSTDESLNEQLKALYLKQELSRFVFANQATTQDPVALQRAFQAFITRVQPADLDGPTWRPGADSEHSCTVDNRNTAGASHD
ncbi:MAG: hypothetical protein ACPG4U_06695 [Pseudomonadales bacterium]